MNNPTLSKKRWSIPVAQEGLVFIVPMLVLTVFVAGIGNFFLTVFTAHLTGFVVYFFRDPHRVIPQDDRALLSPADGKIIKIEKTNQVINEIGSDPVCISIFLSVFNVHINRMPCEGTIINTSSASGKFLPAFQDKASLLNNQKSILISNDRVTILVKQITGLVARRIVCWVKKGDHLNSGERFGLIRFGSRVDLFVPAEVEIKVKLGDKVTGGETIIGYLKEKKN